MSSDCTACNSEGRIPCESCGGKPYHKECSECYGWGTVSEEAYDDMGNATGELVEEDCATCFGSGNYCATCEDDGSNECEDCMGTGKMADVD